MSALHRVSLSAKQQASDAGIELIELCSTITEDGRLLDREIEALKQWSDRNRYVDLPARDLLREKVRRVIAVGAISDADRAELQVAIEKVLPPEARHTPKSLARVADVVDRNLPLDTFEFLVADTRQDDRPTVIARYAFSGDEVLLVRDTYSAYSRNAILVRLVSGHDIGHVPEADARLLAPHLDSNLRYRANIKRILTGGHAPIPVIVAEVYSNEALIEDPVRRSGEHHGPPLALGIRTPVRGTPKPKKSYAGIVLFCAVTVMAMLALAIL